MKEILVESNDEYGVHWYREELIQCKDCKYWQDKTTYRDYPVCVDFGREMKAEDFCSKAERKER